MLRLLLLFDRGDCGVRRFPPKRGLSRTLRRFHRVPFEVFSQGDATKHSVTMTDVAAPSGFGSQQVAEKTAFEKQRDILIGQITQVRTRCAFC